VSEPDHITEPTILQIRHVKQGVEIDMSLPPDLFYFKGHFPTRPILPGVVQIDWVVRFADSYLQTNIGSAQEFNVKFKSIIEPNSVLTMVLTKSSDNRKLDFDYHDETGVMSSGSLSLIGRS
jgi:3-hydroxymyristoyl/3-hydroxydecanoyl-(acyl carrier protein) dehydratase